MNEVQTFHRIMIRLIKCSIVLILYFFHTSGTFAQQMFRSVSLEVVSALRRSPADDTLSFMIRKERKTFFDRQAVRIELAPTIFFTASALTWGERKSIRSKRNRYIPG